MSDEKPQYTIQELLTAGADVDISAHQSWHDHMVEIIEMAPLRRAAMGLDPDPSTLMENTCIGRHGITPLMALMNGYSVTRGFNAGQDGVIAALYGSATLDISDEDITARDHLGRSALDHAVINGRCVEAAVMIDSGFDVNASGEDGKTALHHAAGKQHGVRAVRFLLDKGVNVYAVDAEGKTALHYAAAAGDVEMVQALLAAGANANIADRYGNRPLHEAALANLPMEGMAALLDKVRDPNAQNNLGNVALHHLAIYGSKAVPAPLLEAVSPGGSATNWGLLVKAGADIHIKNNEGESPHEAMMRHRMDEYRGPNHWPDGRSRKSRDSSTGKKGAVIGAVGFGL